MSSVLRNFSHACPTNSRPLSDKSCRGTPKWGITWVNNALQTVAEVWSFEGIRIVYLE